MWWEVGGVHLVILACRLQAVWDGSVHLAALTSKQSSFHGRNAALRCSTWTAAVPGLADKPAAFCFLLGTSYEGYASRRAT